MIPFSNFMSSTLHEVTWLWKQAVNAREHKSDILGGVSFSWCPSVATSLTLPRANLNITLALLRYHLVQRGILTQAQREIDFPHGFLEALVPDTQLQWCLCLEASAASCHMENWPFP